MSSSSFVFVNGDKSVDFAGGVGAMGIQCNEHTIDIDGTGKNFISTTASIVLHQVAKAT
jgi:hypothetical protein